MYTRAEKLHIETDVKRVVYIIETKHEKDTSALETVRTLFAGKVRDFITAVDEKNIILVKEVKGRKLTMSWIRPQRLLLICSIRKR